jgi:hypothetical protein
MIVNACSLDMWRGGLTVVRVAHVVVRVAVLHLRRPAGHHLGQLVHDLLRLAPLHDLEEVRVAVEVIEVLQDAELVRLLEVRVRLHSGHPGGQVDRHLLVRDGRLQRARYARQQPVDRPLLLRLDVPQVGQLAAYVRVRAHPREVVVEQDRLHLDAVHRDDPATGVGIGPIRIDGLHIQLAPVPDLAVQGETFMLQWIEHSALPWRPVRIGGSPARSTTGAAGTAMARLTVWPWPYAYRTRRAARGRTGTCPSSVTRQGHPDRSRMAG